MHMIHNTYDCQFRYDYSGFDCLNICSDKVEMRTHWIKKGVSSLILLDFGLRLVTLFKVKNFIFHTYCKLDHNLEKFA